MPTTAASKQLILLLGESIREYTQRTGESQRTVAERSGVHRNVIQRLAGFDADDDEKKLPNSPSLDVAERILHAIGKRIVIVDE